MNGVRAHYQRLLGPVYAWSVSGSADPWQQAAAWLAKHRLNEGHSYLDLGAGFGAHTIALAREGKVVMAVDQDDGLLDQLRSRLLVEHLDAVTWQGDLLDYFDAVPARTWDFILCLGDTLCHLASLDHVQSFLAACARVINQHGSVVLSYRDSTGTAPVGIGRYHQVAQDHRRSLLCLLDIIDEEHLRVTDILTELGNNRLFTRISDYLKIRVSPVWLAARAREAGLDVQRQWQESGFVVQVLGRTR